MEIQFPIFIMFTLVEEPLSVLIFRLINSGKVMSHHLTQPQTALYNSSVPDSQEHFLGKVTLLWAGIYNQKQRRKDTL